jgi:peptide/nickel transport system ATP-binding protein
MQNVSKYNSHNHFSIEIAARSRSLVSIENFSFPENGITVLLGESGIGKSLIARAIYGLLDPKLLDISINKQSFSKYLQTSYAKQLRKNSFFVFQEPSTHLNPMLRLSEQLNEGDLASYQERMESLYRLWQETPREKINDLLKLYPKPYRPSGGEKQRILIAMAFKKIDIRQKLDGNSGTTLYVFDEPTGNLDNFYRNIFIKELFDKYRRQAFTILLITHDYSLISEIEHKHADLAGHVNFKELSRSNGELRLNEFAGVGYLSWLQQPVQKQQRGSLLFQLSERIHIFGRELIISRDIQGRQAGPLTIHAHEMVYLKAKSGVGKTTIAKVIMGLIKAEAFACHIGNLKINAKTPLAVWKKQLWATRIGMVFQHADEALNLNAKVSAVFKGLPVKIDEQRLIRELQYLIGDQIDNTFLQKKVSHMSGGQKQKLNLLRTFLTDPDILILDEPLNGLDFESIKKVMAYLRDKQAQGKGILLISHNEEIFDHFIPEKNIFYLREA